MNSALTSLFVLSLVGWIGGVAFYSLLVLPILFTRLAPSEAGSIAALIFPAYYYSGVVFGALMLVVVLLEAGRGRRGWRAATLVASIMLACQIFAAFVVHPRMQELRGDPSGRAAFQRLHTRSVQLNSIVLLGGLCLVIASGRLVGDKRS